MWQEMGHYFPVIPFACYELFSYVYHIPAYAMHAMHVFVRN